MNAKQDAELGFWKNHIGALGKDGFIAQRKADLEWNMNNLGNPKIKGKVLEVGSGLFSQLEFLPGAKTITSIDPLMGHYVELMHRHNLEQNNVALVTGDGEELPFEDETFDNVICWNVIDHTPNPAFLIAEIFRVLKPGGKLYFEVHFDDQMAPPHYSLWRDDMIDGYFQDFEQEFENCFRNPNYPQTLYYSIFRKAK